MTATHPEFLLYSGATWSFDAALHDAAGAPLDLTDADIAWRLFNSGAALVLELTVGNGIEVIDPATGGQCRIMATATQTAAIPRGSYRDEIIVTGADGFVCVQAVGVINVQTSGSYPLPAVEDPCAILAKLNAARLALLSGTFQTRVKIEDFEVQYSPANIDALNGAIRDYDSMCRRSTGKAPRRFAIGSMMRRTY